MRLSLKSVVGVLLSGILILSVTVIGPAAVAGGYPDKALKMIVPYNPGGGSDMICRIVDKFSKDSFGDNFIFVYKPGAGGAMGAGVLSRSKPDGYTIGTLNVPHMVLQSLTGSGEFTVGSFDYLGQVASDPQILLTPGPSRIKNLKQFVAKAKANPGEMTVGVPGALGAGHIASYMIMEQASIKFTIVPYSGGADLLAALLGNQIDAAVHNIGVVAPEAEKMNLLAVSHTKRHPLMAKVPTFQEEGYQVVSFIGRLFVAPKNLDASRLELLRNKIKGIWDNPEYQASMKKANFSVDYMSGRELEAFLKDYAGRSEKLLKKYFKK